MAGKFLFFFHNQNHNVIYSVVFFLQDVLKASDVELDGMFKLSFAYDIVNVSQFIYAACLSYYHQLVVE